MNSSGLLYSGSIGWQVLQTMVLEHAEAGIYILADTNTQKYCLPVLRKKCNGLENAKLIILQSGESVKNLQSLEFIWNELHSLNAVRNSLFICLGGGVITDIGGFAAATFKRGIDFVNIPTTLLAMVDAGLGGKTGINFNSAKNQLGMFAMPLGVFIFIEFLNTLPSRQKLSGYAEMLKHAMLDSDHLFDKLIVLNSPEKVCQEAIILESAAVKLKIVEQDSLEKGKRKVLNLGHSIGHAIEAYSQKNDPDPLLHGEAVAIGLICECFISMRMFGMPEPDLEKLANLISWHFPHYRLKHGAAEELLALMSHDKKNPAHSQLNFSLIRKVGDPVFDQFPGEKLIRESLHFYMNLEVGFFV